VNAKILVTGFQRSGTTLTRRLIEFHPDVWQIKHEARILRHPKKLAKITAPIWGDKVPWNSGNGHEVMSYADRWVQRFGEAHRIIQVIRDPAAVARSNGRAGMMPEAEALRRCENSVPKLHDYLKKYNYMSFRYEDLVEEPEEWLAKIYEFCGLEVTPEILYYSIRPKKDPKFLGVIKGGINTPKMKEKRRELFNVTRTSSNR
jgi:hypothetical protein